MSCRSTSGFVTGVRVPERIRPRRPLVPHAPEVTRSLAARFQTQAQVAQELDLPLGTVKSRTLLGMRRLRSLLLEREQ